jgi:hypothetical protein
VALISPSVGSWIYELDKRAWRSTVVVAADSGRPLARRDCPRRGDGESRLPAVARHHPVGVKVHRAECRGSRNLRTSVGRQMFTFDLSELLSSHGPNAFVDAFYENDPHAFDQICAALGAT